MISTLIAEETGTATETATATATATATRGRPCRRIISIIIIIISISISISISILESRTTITGSTSSVSSLDPTRISTEHCFPPVRNLNSKTKNEDDRPRSPKLNTNTNHYAHNKHKTFIYPVVLSIQFIHNNQSRRLQ